MPEAGGTAMADGYDAHYLAKLWSLVPEVYRVTTTTGSGTPPALRALIEVLAAQAADIRRDIDRIWDDQSIESADAWAVEAIAELLGTRRAAVMTERQRRIDVANTIHFRRRRGTPAVLEAIADDLTDWEAALVESYTTLARSPHLLDPPLSGREGRARAGRLSDTPTGGLADLRRPLAAAQTGGPFDEYHHTADVRRQRGTQGRHRIDGVLVHLWRGQVLELNGTDPVEVGVGIWSLDPSGRDVPLFAPGRDRVNRWRVVTARREARTVVDCPPTRPWNVPGPLSCWQLNHEEFRIDLEDIRALDPAPTAAQETALLSLVGLAFPSREVLAQHLASLGMSDPTTLPWWPHLLDLTLVGTHSEDPQACARAVLWPDAVQLSVLGGGIDHAFRRSRIQGASLHALTTIPTPADTSIRGLVDPERGRAAIRPGPAAPPRVDRYHVAVPHLLGAGPYAWTSTVTGGTSHANGGAVTVEGGTHRFMDDRTYAVTITDAATGTRSIAALPGTRPYLMLTDGSSPGARLRPAAGAPSLTLEGLWLGVDGGADRELTLSTAPGGMNPDWSTVTIRHCTLDPGGTRPDATAIGALRLTIEGDVDRLVVDHCILGRLTVTGTVGELVVTDSIVDARDSTAPAIDAPAAHLDMRRVTVVGAIACERLRATDCLVAGRLVVGDTQAGCFRFSAADGDSRFPPRYRSWPAPGAPDRVEPAVFASMRFGDPDYLDLHAAAPARLRRGSERGEQLGAYESRRAEAKDAGLQSKFDEYAPARAAVATVVET
jgi:hypothetical protein